MLGNSDDYFYPVYSIVNYLVYCLNYVLLLSVSVLYSEDNPCLRQYGEWGRLNVVSELWLSLVLEYNILKNSSEIEPVVFKGE